MFHINYLQEKYPGGSPSLMKKASGRYYTSELVGHRLAGVVAEAFNNIKPNVDSIRIIDPFGGDGRLIDWFISNWIKLGYHPVCWNIELWDLHEDGFELAQNRFDWVVAEGHEINLTFKVVDSFQEACNKDGAFDIVLTNPPWELLKPDKREIELLPKEIREEYVSKMRSYDSWIAANYPISQPKRKFAGWGTNLSRVGLEVCLRLVPDEGIIGAVLPASILADYQTVSLRKKLLMEHALLDIGYYPAEAKLYDNADISSVTVVARKSGPPSTVVPLFTHCIEKEDENITIEINSSSLEKIDFVLPVAFGARAMELLNVISSRYPKWSEFETCDCSGLWAGREVDETGSSKWLMDKNGKMPLFIKGKMIDRYIIREVPDKVVARSKWTPPASAAYKRIVWRDVSRPSQKRRMIATEIPSGWVAGNSLGVAYFRDGNDTALRVLLGVMNSTVFEFQLRAYLATGHVSLSALRKVSVPSMEIVKNEKRFAKIVTNILDGNKNSEVIADAYVAKQLYSLTENEYLTVLKLFGKITPDDRVTYIEAYRSLNSDVLGEDELLKDEIISDQNTCLSQNNNFSLSRNVNNKKDNSLNEIEENESGNVLIFNHLTGRLSALDMQVVYSVPEGGNWKNIPESVPSKRIEQIRESYKRGGGSRSTYYGRLRRDRPSYTINTSLNRPGNGCHIHYEQDRVMSQREAARFQSFPDSFEFIGGQGAVNTQIGNAVPPLLAFQIAKTLGEPGVFIDLFSGAGGMGLGFKWAGWKPIVANDIEAKFLLTYSQNVHKKVIVGSITESVVFKKLVSAAEYARATGLPFWVLGGPPCQGFSTAGSKRTMEDSRNHLVWDYVRFLDQVRPDGFIFENVTGLLSMQGGTVFNAVREAFSSVMPSLGGQVLSTDNYAIPQRRKRLILVGQSSPDAIDWEPPEPITKLNIDELMSSSVPQAVTVEEAISDLPPLQAGENGSGLEYLKGPNSVYQALMRGFISPNEYLELIGKNERIWHEIN